MEPPEFAAPSVPAPAAEIRPPVDGEPGRGGPGSSGAQPPPAAPAAAPQGAPQALRSPIEVAAQAEVRLATGGAVHVEALDPSIVDVREVAPGTIGIRGVRPGDTAIVVLTAGDVLVWPVHVTPAPILPTTPLVGPGGVLDAFYQPLPNPAIAGPIVLACDNLGSGAAYGLPWACAPYPGNWAALFERGDLQGAFAPGAWNLNFHPNGGIQVATASYLPTPIEPFGSPPAWGIDARAPWGTELVYSPSGVDVLQHVRIPNGDAFAGATSLGPLAGIQVSFRPMDLQVSTLYSGGQVLAAGALIVHSGDVTVSYIASPIGNGIIAHFTRNPFDLAVAFSGTETDVGVAYNFSGGQTVQALWSSVGGFQVAFVAPLGGAVTRTTIVAGQPQFSAILDTSQPEVTTVPMGPGSLALTPVLIWGGSFGAHLRLPLGGPPMPPPPAPLEPAAPAGTLIVRACVNSRGGDTCTQSDPALLPTVLVDGTPVSMSGTGLSVSAGRHRVAVPPEAVPPLLVPLRGLTCDLVIPAFGVGVCELPFRREGAP